MSEEHDRGAALLEQVLQVLSDRGFTKVAVDRYWHPDLRVYVTHHYSGGRWELTGIRLGQKRPVHWDVHQPADWPTADQAVDQALAGLVTT